jgi:8-oxo-dGTP pyrophosphatase MutT (NUDIX family)/phosphohistidine phosphatase SixA
VASKTAPIRAAGGVVFRGGQIAVVHRPRYDDWSLPKGKLSDGESPAACAAREIAEETGARVGLQQLITRVKYPVESATKIVDYWRMRFLEGDFGKSDEVDELDWLQPDEARARLTYRHDRQVIDAAMRARELDSVLVLVRHARAGSRADWSGPDETRPLEQSGQAQAEALAPFLMAFAPERIVAADRTRCVQTIEPLSKVSGLPIDADARLSDQGYARDPKRSLNAVHTMLAQARTVVLCSQGDAIPALLHDLRCVSRSTPARTRKGGAWVIGFVGSRAVTAEYYRTPLSPR